MENIAAKGTLALVEGETNLPKSMSREDYLVWQNATISRDLAVEKANRAQEKLVALEREVFQKYGLRPGVDKLNHDTMEIERAP